MHANQIVNASGNEQNNENSNMGKWGKVKERRRREKSNNVLKNE